MFNQLGLAWKKLTGAIDWLNDKLTSYRLMLYYLLTLLGWAIVGSFFNKVPYNWHQILFSAAWLVAICWLTNKIISRFLDIPANKESDLISGLILALILAPPTTAHNFALVAAAGMAAMASKYVIAIYKGHIFNPAATGAFVAGEIFHYYPAWWVGTKFMAPVIVLGGILIMRKMKRFWMVLLFFAVFIAYQIYNTGHLDVHLLWLELISTPLLFFGYVMLTEPLTSPTTENKYLPYAVLVGILYSVTALKLSPEEALLIGNIFTFLSGPNRRYKLKFIRRLKEADGIYSYLFSLPPKFSFTAGQYMEWTIAHNKTDSRGNRRYFTISSSPTEPGLMITVKQPPKASAFKQKLEELKPGDSILAAHLAGNFTLPKDTSKKVALLAGGVGITPFRSMVKNLVDSGEQRDVALLYSANSQSELSFTKLFERAKEVGVQTSYVTQGHLDKVKIADLMPDYAERTHYVSGPYGFVQAVESALLQLGVRPTQIITDYFPGYGG